MTGETNREIWVFGDYRNYFQNRVTLQLIARATQLSRKIGGKVCAVVFGCGIDEYVGEYVAHGADKVYVADDPALENYSIELYSFLMERLAKSRKPEIVLSGATDFGREFAPRVAGLLKTGLSADCIGLEINNDGLLVQTAPSFGGNLLAEIVTPDCRPQMATVRPGVFQELPHDDGRSGEIVEVPVPGNMPRERVKIVSSERCPRKGKKIEDATIVVCGGRGMGSKKKFRRLYELAGLLEGEVGATRPVVHSGWADHDVLVGQAGRQIKPDILFSFGISGAIQHTAAISNSKYIIAVNKNPKAAMMKTADVAIVADAHQFCSTLIRELKKRVR